MRTFFLALTLCACAGIATLEAPPAPHAYPSDDELVEQSAHHKTPATPYGADEEDEDEYEDAGIEYAANYVVNLPENTDTHTFNRAVATVQKTGVTILSQYPQLSSFTFQAAPSLEPYEDTLATQLSRAHITIHSIDFIRYARADEILVKGTEGSKEAAHTLEYEKTWAQGTHQGWDREIIGADEAGMVDVQLAPVTIAVMDTGIDASHPALQGKIDQKLSVSCEKNGIPAPLRAGNNDTYGHGTHIAGILVAQADKTSAPAGIAPHATLADIRVLDNRGIGGEDTFTCGLIWAADKGIPLANVSYGRIQSEFAGDAYGRGTRELRRRAVAYATSKNVLMVAAAGNEDIDVDNMNATPYYDTEKNTWHCIPLAHEEKLAYAVADENAVVSVAAVQPATGKKVLQRAVWNVNSAVINEDGVSCSTADASNYGKTRIALAAPGTSIQSLTPTGTGRDTGILSGTSTAAAHVTGVAALMKGVHPDYTATRIRALLEQQARTHYDTLASPIDGKEYRGYGLVNALDAVLYDQPQPVIEKMYYSTDKGVTWLDIADAIPADADSVRIVATGAVTKLAVTIGDIHREAGLAGDASNEIQLDIDLSPLPAGQRYEMRVNAYGRNNDSRADDDVQHTKSFTKTAHTAAPTCNGGACVQRDVPPYSLSQTGVPIAVGLATVLFVTGVLLRRRGNRAVPSS